MSTRRLGLAAAAVAALAFVGSANGQAVTQAGIASPWIELGKARIRLLAGGSAAGQAKVHLAGIEVVLAEGWKTYWRMPGDAGVPPSFDWRGSTNVASVKVLYPAPARMPEPAAQTIGYKTSVVFPVEVTPQDAGKPVELKLSMELGVCRDICIPAEANISLALPAKAAGAPPAAIATALERVPRQQAARRSTDPELKQVSASLSGPSPRILVEARFPGGAEGADVFIEAPDGLYVPMTRQLSQADGIVRFEASLARMGNAAELKGKQLTLTLVSDAGASEAVWTVP